MRLIPIEGKENAHLFRHPKSGIIYFKMFRKDKGQLERSTKTTVPKEARVAKDKILQEWLGLKPKTPTLLLISELWPKWVETKSDKSDGTKDSIKYSEAHLLEFFGGYLPNEITPALWERYIVKKREESSSRKFFNEWKWFNMFALFLRDHGHLEIRPKLRNPDPKKKGPGKVYSPEEIKKLVANANEDLRLQILMAYTMGMRIGEILGMEWDRIDLKKQTVELFAEHTKIRKGRKFGISEDVLFFLKKRTPKKGPLFPSPEDPKKSIGSNKTAWRICKRNAKVVGRFHDLRHSFLTNAFRNAKGQMDSMLICEYAGLSIEMAQSVYLHFNEEDTRAVTKLVGI